MSKWHKVKIGKEEVNLQYSEKHGRWDVLYNNKLYFCQGIPKSTNPVQVADIFYREGRDSTVFFK